jgi:hypothetical protein
MGNRAPKFVETTGPDLAVLGWCRCFRRTGLWIADKGIIGKEAGVKGARILIVESTVRTNRNNETCTLAKVSFAENRALLRQFHSDPSQKYQEASVDMPWP